MNKILIVLFLLMSFEIYSQQIVPVENFSTSDLYTGQKKYYKDVNGLYNKFIGKWKYQNNSLNPTEIVEVVFYKQEMFNNSGNYFSDILYARFKYTKNGQVVFNNLVAVAGSPLPLYIFGDSFRDPANTNKLFLQYGEPTAMDSNRKDWLNIEYLPGTPAKLNWKMEWYPLDENVTAPEMPATMVLTKVD